VQRVAIADSEIRLDGHRLSWRDGEYEKSLAAFHMQHCYQCQKSENNIGKGKESLNIHRSLADV
jgi:hypothetical protein